MHQVVDSVSENGLNFEIYDDGDCVLTNSHVGFVQFSAALIARLARKAGASGQRKAVNSAVTLAPAGLIPKIPNAEPTVPASAPDDKPSGTVRRTNIQKLPEAQGWQCTLVNENNHSVTHAYESRTYARAGLPQTPIGQGGRIA